jgi:hypothetical protein
MLFAATLARIVPQHTPVPRSPRARRHSLRAIARILAHFAQLRHGAIFERHCQFQRRPRPLPHRACPERRRQRRIPRLGRKAFSRRTRKAARHLHRALPQFAERSALQKIPPRLWLRRRVLDGIQLGRPGFGEAYKKALREPRTSIEITASAKSFRAGTISSS